MKKYLFLSFILCAVISTATLAQTTGSGPSAQAKPTEPATILQQMKDKVKPQMMEKTGLTEAQVDKVIELNFEMRMAASAIDANDADRAAKIAELKAAKEKKMSELLTADQIKAVKSFYEEMGKSMKKAGS